MPADIRFPLERANGVQIVKTAAALARRGRAHHAARARTAIPRPTDEILALYGVAPQPGLRRAAAARPATAAGSFALPRASFLARAALAALPRPAPRRGRLHARPAARRPAAAPAPARRPRGLRGARGGGAHVRASAARSTAPASGPTRARRARLRGARGRRVAAGAAAFVTTTARHPRQLRRGLRRRARACAWSRTAATCPRTARSPAWPRSEPPRVLYAGQLYPWKGVDVLVEAMAAGPARRGW